MKSFLIVLGLLAALSVQASASIFDGPCSYQLLNAQEVSRQKAAAYRDLQGRFFTSRQMLFWENTPDPVSPTEFYSSNETDWHIAEMDFDPVDVVIGFGTNNVWDIAVRKDAKIMVIGDHVAGPLIGQEYILKAMFKHAQTRAQFLGLLRSIPVRLDSSNLSLLDLFDHVHAEMRFARGQERQLFMDAILEDVRTDPELGPLYAQVLEQYYSSLFMYEIGLMDFPEHLQILKTPFSPSPIYSPRAYMVPEIADSFVARYSPQNKRGVPRDFLEHPFASFLSSEAAYQRLRHLFVSGNVFYVRSDFQNQEIYRRVAHLALTRGYKTMAISTSNIADVIWAEHFDVENKSNDFYRAFMGKTAKTLWDMGIASPLTFFQTRNWMLPHRFERHRIQPKSK